MLGGEIDEDTLEGFRFRQARCAELINISGAKATGEGGICLCFCFWSWYWYWVVVYLLSSCWDCGCLSIEGGEFGILVRGRYLDRWGLEDWEGRKGDE